MHLAHIEGRIKFVMANKRLALFLMHMNMLKTFPRLFLCNIGHDTT